jgi:glycosyltransferase involved in cell wall biosynthesis
MNAGARPLIVVTSRYPFASQEAYLTTELRELQQHFDNVVVVPVRPPASPARHMVPKGVTVLPWPLFSGELLWRAAKVVATRPKVCFQMVADVLTSRDPGRAKNFAVLLKALALAHWAKQHRATHIHAYWISTPATVAMIAAKISGLPWSSTAHRWDIYERNAFDLKESSLSFVRAISARGARDLRRQMPGLNGRVLQLGLGIVIPSAVSKPRPNSEFRIACPAAFGPVKGHTTLFAAVARLRRSKVPVRCTLFGTGPLQAELEAAAANPELEGAVEFAGFVPQERLHTAYRAGQFAAVVLASHAVGERMMEGVPSALLEAMAFGVPVVATDSGSIGEVLDDRCGLLVTPGDPDQLAAALLKVYLDPEGAHERAQRAYEVVASHHNVDTQMRELAVALNRKE